MKKKKVDLYVKGNIVINSKVLVGGGSSGDMVGGLVEGCPYWNRYDVSCASIVEGNIEAESIILHNMTIAASGSISVK